MAVQLQTQLNATDTQIGALQARGLELRRKMTELEDAHDRGAAGGARIPDGDARPGQRALEVRGAAEATDGCGGQRGRDRRRHRRQVPRQDPRRRCRTSRPSRSASLSSPSPLALALDRRADVDRVRADARPDGARRARHPRHSRRDAVDGSAGHRAARAQPAPQGALGVRSRRRSSVRSAALPHNSFTEQREHVHEHHRRGSAQDRRAAEPACSTTDQLRGQARLRRVPATPVDTSHAQRFQPVTLDKAALHDALVLPQLAGRRGIARVQDPAHARAAAPGSEPVALVRRHRRDRRRGQDPDGDQSRDGAGAGHEHVGGADRPGSATPSCRRLSGFAQQARREGPERLSAGQRQLREHHVLPGHRAARGDPELLSGRRMLPRC